MLILGCTDIGASKDSNRTGVLKSEKEIIFNLSGKCYPSFAIIFRHTQQILKARINHSIDNPKFNQHESINFPLFVVALNQNLILENAF
jgi:hypothetical protein